MGKGLLLMVTAVMIAGGLMVYHGSGQSARRAGERSAEYQAKVLAREIALSAYEVGVQRVQNKGPWPASGDVGTYQGGTYKVTYKLTPVGSANPTQVEVRATGTMPYHGEGGTPLNKEHVIVATYELGAGSGPGTETVPEYMRYGLLSEKTITMNGGVTITSEINTVNADIHTNQNLQVNNSAHNPNRITGFGTYVGNQTLNGPNAFVPNVPDGQSPTRRTARVDIPLLDVNNYKNRATITKTGKFDLSGTHHFGTRENPTIYFVQGDLEVKNGAKFSGYVVFLVTGNVLLNSFTNISGTDYNESNIAFYANGDVNFNNNASIIGQIYARNNVNFFDKSKFYGSVTTNGLINFNGKVDITYRQASAALTTMLPGASAPPPEAYTLQSVREH